MGWEVTEIDEEIFSELEKKARGGKQGSIQAQLLSMGTGVVVMIRPEGGNKIHPGAWQRSARVLESRGYGKWKVFSRSGTVYVKRVI